jgi:hypothetical protein
VARSAREREVMPPNASALVHFDRALIRALLRYVRRLERDTAEGGILVSDNTAAQDEQFVAHVILLNNEARNYVRRTTRAARTLRRRTVRARVCIGQTGWRLARR